MILENEIHQQLAAYLSHEMNLDDFEDWLIGHSWDMHLDSSEEAQSLVAAIELRLAEHSDGHLDHDGLNSEFRSLLGNSAAALPGSKALPIA